MAWFKSKNTLIKRSHFKNLLELAMIDGDFDDNEQQHLIERAEGWGLKKSDIDAVLKNPNGVERVFPDSHDDRLLQLFDLIVMMVADGDILEIEMDYVQTLAVHMGFSASAAPKMLEQLCESARAEEKPSVDAQQFLNS